MGTTPDVGGTKWLLDQESVLDKADGVVEVWVKKIYGPGRSPERKPPASADVELWSLSPDRKIEIVQIIRLGSRDEPIETIYVRELSISGARSFPPGSVMELVWLVLYGKYKPFSPGLEP